MAITIEQAAQICHEANLTFCASLKDFSQKSWKDAPEWQRKSAITGVKFHLARPRSNPSDSHSSWLEEKRRDGWKYGAVKDPVKKEHPCFVPFEALPVEQQRKDYLFLSIVRALEPIIENK